MNTTVSYHSFHSFIPEHQLKFYCEVKRLEGLSFEMCCSSQYFRANCLANWIASDACTIDFQLCPTELQNNCACVTYDPVGARGRENLYLSKTFLMKDQS